MMSPMNHRENTESNSNYNPIPTEALAAIIVDALLDDKLIQRVDTKRAIEIVIDKIEGRKEIGDYS